MPHHHRKKIIDIASAIALLTLIMLDIVLWRNIFVARKNGSETATSAASAPRKYSFQIAHSTSTLLIFSNGVTVLTDAGPDATIVDDLQKTLPAGAPTYIDIAIISSPQTNDYEGYQYLLQHYGVGAFLYNGRADMEHKTEWTQLMNTITTRHIPLITIGAGDRIRLGSAEIDILAPDVAHAHSPNASDTAIVEHVVLLYNK
jgi:beta-lactamase superfamily II metal-dependent hydrolase